MANYPIFATSAPAADYLRKNGVGAVCGITTQTLTRTLKHKFRGKGLVVSAKPTSAHTVVTLGSTSEALAEAKRAAQRAHNGSQRRDGEATITQALAPGLAIDQVLQVKGNGQAIRKVMRQRFGAGNYKMNKDGHGWVVTRKA